MPTLLGLIPDPSWLNPGDNAWQLTSATLVGLMSVPGLAVLYGGVVQKRWAVNSAMMAFYAFAMVLIVWVLWGFKAGFGSPWQGLGTGSGFLSNFIGVPGPVLDHVSEQARAGIPLLSGTGAMPQFRFPQSSLIYFQFVFAAITPILILGSVIGRINFKAWMLFVPLWSGLVYSVNAFLLWGGGWWAQQGAVDYSGGYVIHLAAGVSGFVAAAVVGPRLLRDRRSADPNNLLMVMAGAGLLWLGWNGFNGGDPYFSNADASAAVLNTNLAAATAMLTWMMMDVIFSGKPAITGAVNGMITGLVAITPAAGFVNGVGAILIGVAASSLPWVTLNVLGQRGIFKRVDDDCLPGRREGVAVLGGRAVLHRQRPPVLDPARRRGHDHRVRRIDDVRHHEAHQPDRPAPPARRRARDRRHGHPRRGAGLYASAPAAPARPSWARPGRQPCAGGKRGHVWGECAGRAVSRRMLGRLDRHQHGAEVQPLFQPRAVRPEPGWVSSSPRWLTSSSKSQAICGIGPNHSRMPAPFFKPWLLR
jgi:Amt family ammonium transporter